MQGAQELISTSATRRNCETRHERNQVASTWCANARPQSHSVWRCSRKLTVQCFLHKRGQAVRTLLGEADDATTMNEASHIVTTNCDSFHSQRHTGPLAFVLFCHVRVLHRLLFGAILLSSLGNILAGMFPVYKRNGTCRFTLSTVCFAFTECRRPAQNTSQSVKVRKAARATSDYGLEKQARPFGQTIPCA
jgi:hypothetical protein